MAIRAVVRGGNACLTRGVEPTLENHRKSLGHYSEGHFIMPSELAGFGYVDAIRAVFSGGGQHDDAVPTEAQKRRFTVLYPKD